VARRLGVPLVFTYHTRYEKYAHYVPAPERLVAALAVRLACRFADQADLVIAALRPHRRDLRAAGCGRASPSFRPACRWTASVRRRRGGAARSSGSRPTRWFASTWAAWTGRRAWSA
jgi:hypothetical protein